MSAHSAATDASAVRGCTLRLSSLLLHEKQCVWRHFGAIMRHLRLLLPNSAHNILDTVSAATSIANYYYATQHTL
eukprot:12709-Heterococcus_DN1.PRE.7